MVGNRLLALVIGGFGLPGVLFAAARVQVPAGRPYDPEVHPNAIVTFVENDDFEVATYEEARAAAGTELLGLSGNRATRGLIEVAPARTLEVRVLGRSTEVLSFPVIRQRFDLPDGRDLELYSFRTPRTDLPSDDAEAMLNAAALSPPSKDEEGRFGEDPLPESLSIRGQPALLFDEEEKRTLFWQEGRISYVAVAGFDAETLFVLVEDLL